MNTFLNVLVMVSRLNQCTQQQKNRLSACAGVNKLIETVEIGANLPTHNTLSQYFLLLIFQSKNVSPKQSRKGCRFISRCTLQTSMEKLYKKYGQHPTVKDFFGGARFVFTRLQEKKYNHQKVNSSRYINTKPGMVKETVKEINITDKSV